MAEQEAEFDAAWQLLETYRRTRDAALLGSALGAALDAFDRSAQPLGNASPGLLTTLIDEAVDADSSPAGRAARRTAAEAVGALVRRFGEHPGARSAFLATLAQLRYAQYLDLGDGELLDQGVQAVTESISLCPPGDSGLPQHRHLAGVILRAGARPRAGPIPRVVHGICAKACPKRSRLPGRRLR